MAKLSFQSFARALTVFLLFVQSAVTDSQAQFNFDYRPLDDKEILDKNNINQEKEDVRIVQPAQKIIAPKPPVDEQVVEYPKNSIVIPIDAAPVNIKNTSGTKTAVSVPKINEKNKEEVTVKGIINKTNNPLPSPQNNVAIVTPKSPVLAVDNEKNIPEISLKTAVDLALKDSPDRNIANAQISIAESGKAESESLYYPQLNAKVDGGREYNDRFANRDGATDKAGYNYANGAGFNLRQMLFDGFVTRESVAQKMKQIESTKLNKDKVTEEIILSTIQVYTQMLQYQQIVTASEKNYASLQAISKLVDLRSKAGDTSASEEKYITGRLSAAEQEKIKAYAALEDSKSALEFLIGKKPERVSVLQQLAPIKFSDANQALDITMKKNTDVLYYIAEKESLQHELNSAQGKYSPDLNFVVNGQHSEDSGGDTGVSRSVTGKLELNFKILDGGLRDAGISRSTAKIREVDAKIDRMRRELKQNVNQTFNKLQSSQQESELSIKEIEANKQFEEVSRQQFINGDADLDITKLVESQERIFSAQVKNIRSNNEYVNSYYTLQRLTGALLNDFCSGVCR